MSPMCRGHLLILPPSIHSPFFGIGPLWQALGTTPRSWGLWGWPRCGVLFPQPLGLVQVGMRPNETQVIRSRTSVWILRGREMLPGFQLNSHVEPESKPSWRRGEIKRNRGGSWASQSATPRVRYHSVFSFCLSGLSFPWNETKRVTQILYIFYEKCVRRNRRGWKCLWGSRAVDTGRQSPASSCCRSQNSNAAVSWSRACKLRPKGQLQLTACFCAAWGLRMVFTFLNGWKKSQKENNRSWCQSYTKFQFQHP